MTRIFVIVLGSFCLCFFAGCTPIDPRCNTWEFAAATHRQVNSVNDALQLYPDLLSKTNMFQDTFVSTDPAQFKHQFNLLPTFTAKTVINAAGRPQTLDGYDMVLSHFIDLQGNFYQYIMCQKGQPITKTLP